MFLISQSFVDVYKKDSNTTLNFWIIMSVMWSSEWVTEYNPIIFDSYVHATIPKWLSFGNVEWLTSVLMYSILESPTYHPFAVWVVTNKKLIKEMYTLRTRRSSRGTYRQSRHANLQPIHIAPGVAVSNQRSVGGGWFRTNHTGTSVVDTCFHFHPIVRSPSMFVYMYRPILHPY